MKHKYLKFIIFIVSSSLILLSCVERDVIIDTDELTTWDRALNIDIPLANAYFNSHDLIERIGDSLQDYIKVCDDGLLCIKYKDSIYTVWEDIVQINEVNFQKDYSVYSLKKSTKSTISYEDKIKINQFSIQRFDSTYIAEGTLTMNIQFPQNYTGSVTFSFPELVKNGNKLSYTYNIAEDRNPIINADLSDYFLEFKHGEDSSYITLSVVANVTADGNTTSTVNDIISVSLYMPPFSPKILFGYFGNINVFDQDQNMSFHFFEDMKMDTVVEFKEIEMIIEFNNYFGTPFNGIMTNAKLTRDDFNGTLDVDLQGDNVFPVEKADYISQSVVPYYYSRLIDTTNSNIKEAVNFYPDNLDYHMVIEINPDNDSEQINFVTQDNYIAGNTYVIIPLWFRTSAYNRIDTINFKISSLLGKDRVDYVKYVELSFNFENYFPFELNAQAYPIDLYGNIIDTLFEEDQQLIESGILNSSDSVISASETNVTIHIDQDQLIKYRDENVENILLATRTITSNNGDVFVKLYDIYGISFKLTMSVTSDELTK